MTEAPSYPWGTIFAAFNACCCSVSKMEADGLLAVNDLTSTKVRKFSQITTMLIYPCLLTSLLSSIIMRYNIARWTDNVIIFRTIVAITSIWKFRVSGDVNTVFIWP